MPDCPIMKKMITKEEIEKAYPGFWVKPKPAFTPLEIAVMEGGHSLEENNTEAYSFIKFLKNTPTLGPLNLR